MNKKAPRVQSPSKKKPNFMQENPKAVTRKSPMQPMKRKSLSK